MTKDGDAMTNPIESTRQLSRRSFVRDGSLLMLGTGIALAKTNDLYAGESEIDRPLRVGLVTDLHYADKPPAGSRHYRESLGKLAEATHQFSNDKPEFVVELGDLIDAADSVETELSYLKRINKDFSAICKSRHYVLGNHCVATLTKEEFLGEVEQERSYYSFDVGEFHFIVLDSCFRSDGEPYGRNNFDWTDANIPDDEVKWLQADLKDTEKKTIVFAHQRLDVTDHYSVKNAAEVRRVLEAAESVVAVLQGHSHENDYQDISGIHYCTLVAMVEGSGADNSGFSTMEIAQDGTIRVTGFRKQESYAWG
ncbi:MAG: metallophosphoesterase [Aeoliella sp.]